MGLGPDDPQSSNPYIRAALSENVRAKVQEGQQIGPIGSVTLGTQASGKKVSGNLGGLRFSLGYTAGKVEHTGLLPQRFHPQVVCLYFSQNKHQHG